MNLYRINKNIIFLVSQKALIEKRKRLLILKNSLDQKWELPGGFIEVNENLTAALKRETREETRLKIGIGKPISTSVHWHKNFKLADGRTVNARVVKICYYCSYISGNISLSSEHTDYVWVPKNGLKNYRFAANSQFAINSYLRGAK